MALPETAKSKDQKLVERYEALLRVNDVISQYRDLNELFRHLAVYLRSIVPFEVIALGLHDKERLQ